MSCFFLGDWGLMGWWEGSFCYFLLNFGFSVRVFVFGMGFLRLFDWCFFCWIISFRRLKSAFGFFIFVFLFFIVWNLIVE